MLRESYKPGVYVPLKALFSSFEQLGTAVYISRTILLMLFSIIGSCSKKCCSILLLSRSAPDFALPVDVYLELPI